jgi:hypothetical protein
VLTLGVVRGPGGVQYLSCASMHLTAFLGARGGPGVHFSVNAVHPIDDAGSIAMILDPSNVRPAMACGVVVAVLVCLFFVARAHRVDNDREQRHALYCKLGSFTSGLGLASVPQDVS